MPRWMLVILFAVFALAILVVGTTFMSTGPTKNQTRSPDEPTREQNQLSR